MAELYKTLQLRCRKSNPAHPGGVLRTDEIAIALHRGDLDQACCECSPNGREWIGLEDYLGGTGPRSESAEPGLHGHRLVGVGLLVLATFMPLAPSGMARQGQGLILGLSQPWGWPALIAGVIGLVCSLLVRPFGRRPRICCGLLALAMAVICVVPLLAAQSLLAGQWPQYACAGLAGVAGVLITPGARSGR